MNKAILLFAVLTLITVSFVAADACSIKDLCYNADNDPYCSPTDESCIYKIFTTQGDTCVSVDESTDVDADGWTISCDADDDNASIKVYFGDVDEEEEEEEVITQTTSTKSSRKGGSQNNDGIIKVIITENDNNNSNSTPEEEEDTSSATVVQSEDKSTTSKDPVTEPAKEKEPGMPTGMVAGDITGRTAWSIGFYILLGVIIVGLIFFFIARKKK